MSKNNEMANLFGDPRKSNNQDLLPLSNDPVPSLNNISSPSDRLITDEIADTSVLGNQITDNPPVAEGGSVVLGFSSEIKTGVDAIGGAGKVGSVRNTNKGTITTRAKVQYSDDTSFSPGEAYRSGKMPERVIRHNPKGSEASRPSTTSPVAEPHRMTPIASTDPMESKALSIDINRFELSSLLSRIVRFLASSSNLKEVSLAVEEDRLIPFLKKSYESHFGAPRVSIGVARLASLIEDYLEYSDFKDSIVVENIEDELEAIRSQQEESKSKESHTPSPVPVRPPEVLAIEDLRDMMGSETEFVPEYIHHDQDMEDIKIINTKTFMEKFLLRKSKKETEENRGISILNSGEFENCKKFKCFAFDLYSVAGIGELYLKKKVSSSHSSTFKPCCANYMLQGCPQSKKYTKVEQEIFDSAVDIHKNSDDAHQQILALRLKSI